MISPSDQRARRLIEQVHQLGPAPLLHLLNDIDRGADLVPTLERYASLPADFIRSLGGDRFPSPLYIIRGGRR